MTHCKADSGATSRARSWLGAPWRQCVVGLLWFCIVAATAETGVPVRVVPVVEQPIQRELQLTGTVTADQAARLSVATSGLVTAIHADAGSRVQAGQIVLELDAELASLQLDASRAAETQAGDAVEDAQRRLREAEQLAPQRSIAESVVRDLASEVAQDEAALQQIKAQTAYQQAVVARHQLRAPFAGVISLKSTELGEWVNPGQPVFDLVNMDQVRLDFPVSEDYVASVAEGAPVSISSSAQPGQSYRGRVATVVPVTDPVARTFLLRVLVDNPSHELIPGMSVRASVKLAAGRSGLVVPRDATLRFPDGRVVVWSVEQQQDGTIARENVVQLGLAFDGLVEVRSGLAAGADVVVRGNEALQSGQRVSIQ